MVLLEFDYHTNHELIETLKVLCMILTNDTYVMDNSLSFGVLI